MREEFKAPLAIPDAGYTEISSKITEELEGVAHKVDDILEGECRYLFSVAVTCVFSHLYLRDPGFDFGTVIGPSLGSPTKRRRKLWRAM